LTKSTAYDKTHALLSCGSGVQSPPGRPISLRCKNWSDYRSDQAFCVASFISSRVKALFVLLN